MIMELSTYISSNIKRLRKVKNLSQKEVAMSIDIAQAQYSVIESGKTVPTLTTLEKIANVFEVDLSQLVKKSTIADEDINLSILEKVKLIDTLDKDEKTCLLKMIDIAISKKKMKDNLSNMMKE
jgi:transcriptional regulator with XRE-family HTH domain